MNLDEGYAIVLDSLNAYVTEPQSVDTVAAKLKEWEIIPGFYTILQRIFSNLELRHEIRVLALVFCKNGIDRFWRKTAPNAISEEEKIEVRKSLVANLTEQHRQPVTALLAEVIGKIARYDCPKEWNELIPTLLQGIRNEDPLVQNVSLLVLHSVISHLASKCLAPDKRLFKEMASELIGYIYFIWDSICQNTLVKFQQNCTVTKKSLDNAYLCTKILDKLIAYGFNLPRKCDEINRLMDAIFLRMKHILEMRHALGRLNSDFMSEIIVTCEKLVRRCMKLVINYHENHPISFVDFIKPSLEFCVYYGFNEAVRDLVFDKFLIHCFNLIKAIILCLEYKVVVTDWVTDDANFAAKARAREVMDSFFDKSVVTNMCLRIVNHYFLLNQEDIKLWGRNPEAYFSGLDEGGEAWKYLLRPSTELLFVSLIHQDKDHLIPVILELLSKYHGPISPNDINSILAKDAVYNAVGLVAFDLYDEVDFAKWFVEGLKGEMRVEGSSYRIIRRRIAWLLSKWVYVKFPADLYSDLYESMGLLLQPSEDLVTRITAANTIKSALEEFAFLKENFQPYLHDTFSLVFQLLQDVSDSDTKLKVMDVLHCIIEKIGPTFDSSYMSFLRYLPLLWEESSSCGMLGCSVISSFVPLMDVFTKSQIPQETVEFVINVIQSSTDIQDPRHTYLMEDALSLWQALLENLDKQRASLALPLFNNMPSIFENSGESRIACIKIMKAWVVLAPEELFHIYVPHLVKVVQFALEELNHDAIAQVLRVVEDAMRANPDIATIYLASLLSQVFQTLLCKNVDNFKVMSVTVTLFSRLLIYSQDSFNIVLNDMCQGLSESDPYKVFRTMLDVILQRVPYFYSSDIKMVGLALTSFLSDQFPFLNDKFCAIILAVTEILSEVTQYDETGKRVDFYSEMDGNPGEEDFYESFDVFERAHELRKNAIVMNDPLYTIRLHEFFKSKMTDLQASLGDDKFKYLIDMLDAETLGHVRHYFPV